jgi:hypothetical protein
MTRHTWIGMEQPESTPKEFDSLQADFMQHHFPLLWCVMERRMKKVWCARHRDGWCATKWNRKYPAEAFSVLNNIAVWH